jgi:hypothetical protein
MFLLTVMCVVSTVSVSAQTTSKSSQITLVAIMPETLSLRVNASDTAFVAMAFQDQDTHGVATTVSTSWSLQPGRASLVTCAYYKTNAPVLVASASLPGSVPGTDSPWSGSGTPEFHLRLPALSMPISTAVITPAKLVGENTASLPSNGPAQALDFSPETPIGTLKIQVQAVL